MHLKIIFCALLLVSIAVLIEGRSRHHVSFFRPYYGYRQRYGGYGYGRSRGGGLLGLLFGRRQQYYQPGQCRVAQFVDYVGSAARYYCDCPPYPPNYQYNTCVPMNFGK